MTLAGPRKQLVHISLAPTSAFTVDTAIVVSEAPTPQQQRGLLPPRSWAAGDRILAKYTEKSKA